MLFFLLAQRSASFKASCCCVVSVRSEEYEMKRKGDHRGDYYRVQPEPVVSRHLVASRNTCTCDLHVCLKRSMQIRLQAVQYTSTCTYMTLYFWMLFKVTLMCENVLICQYEVTLYVYVRSYMHTATIIYIYLSSLQCYTSLFLIYFHD